MNILRFLLALSNIFAPVGSGVGTVRATSHKFNDQKVYCEKSYTNFAWGYQHQGIYVDPQGKIYQFKYGRTEKPWVSKQENAFTEQELEAKYNHGRTQIGTIALPTLQEKFKWIVPASQGAMSERKQQGADRGSNVCRCYVYDETDALYKGVDLKVEGDWSYENLAPSAKQLVRWLETLGTSSENKS